MGEEERAAGRCATARGVRAACRMVVVVAEERALGDARARAARIAMWRGAAIVVRLLG